MEGGGKTENSKETKDCRISRRGHLESLTEAIVMVSSWMRTDEGVYDATSVTVTSCTQCWIKLIQRDVLVGSRAT